MVSIGSYYYNVLNADDGVTQNSYSRQINGNLSKQVTLSLNIPIFNNFSQLTEVLKLPRSERMITNFDSNWRKTICIPISKMPALTTTEVKMNFQLPLQTLTINTKSFDAVEKKFESGLVDVTGYSVAKTTLFRAETEALRTKLQLLITETYNTVLLHRRI